MSGVEKNMDENRFHFEDFRDSWAVLVDKGYQGVLEFCHRIYPEKKSVNKASSHSDIVFNKKISSDRIIVENAFGRLRELWTLLSTKKNESK